MFIGVNNKHARGVIIRGSVLEALADTEGDETDA